MRTPQCSGFAKCCLELWVLAPFHPLWSLLKLQVVTFGLAPATAERLNRTAFFNGAMECREV